MTTKVERLDAFVTILIPAHEEGLGCKASGDKQKYVRFIMFVILTPLQGEMNVIIAASETEGDLT